MSEYDNKGQIALWKNDKKGNEKAPSAKGHFFAHRDIQAGEKIEVAFWRNESDNERAPMMKGKISDPMKKEDGFAPSGDSFDDDIPFS